MPQLVALGRKWSIGSDDFVFSGSLDVLVRLIWLIVVIIIFAVNCNELTCDSRYLLKIYYIGVIGILGLTILITSLIVIHSMRGTISNSKPRKHLVTLIYIRLIIAIPEVTWNIVGTVWVFKHSIGCNHSVLNVAKFTVIAGWVLLAIVVIMVLIIYDAFGGKSQKTRKLSQQRSFKRGSRRPMHKTKDWEKRCRCLFCCAAGSDASNSVFTTLAQLSTDYFRGMDLVPTDIAAGLILLRGKHERQTHKLTTESLQAVNLSSENCHPSLSSIRCEVPPADWMTLENMIHYLRIALGSYGWPFYVTLTDPVLGACALCSQCRCCSCCTVSQIHLDNCCQCNTAAFLKTAGMRHDDIVYASFSNGIYETPFYVALDRGKNAIVISVRGTLSMQDIITDLSLERGLMEIDGVTESLAHNGILQSAIYIKQTLEEQKILSKAFSLAEGAKLVVTGHSLGAGAAALLAILLKPTYPDLVCFAYAPPGELVSSSVSEYSRPFICSVILGDDMIPRMGMLMMEELKIKILQELEECHLPKYKILADGCWRLCCGGEGSSITDHKVDDNPRQEQNHSSRSSLQMSVCESLEHSKRIKATYQPLYPPGQIFHVQESLNGGENEWSATWSKPEVFTEIIVSQNMLAHHFPDALLDALEDLREKQTNLHPHIDNANISNV